MLRQKCEQCKRSFSRWIFENGEMVTNVCPGCYYKIVNERELQIQEIVNETLDKYDLKTAIGVFNKLTYPDKDKKKKEKK